MRASINDIWNEEIRISENSEIKTPDHVNKMTPILAKPQLGKAWWAMQQRDRNKR
tara:strand:+ start:296 stop:460 length:165 start_codon:yes stop_codon:yes gene_type:complete